MSCFHPGLTFLGNHIQEPYMVPYRPYKIFLYDLAMVAKISIYDSYMASKNPIWSFVRSFNAHTKLMQQFQLLTLYTTYGILVPYMVLTWSKYGSYMVHIWFLYGSYMVHIWFLYGPYMVLKCFLYGSGMFLTWLLPCPLKVITTKPL